MTDDEHEAVCGLMHALLPGGAGFPAARDTGMADLLAQRLHQTQACPPGRLVQALSSRGGLPGDAAAWHEAAARLEALDPRLFAEVRKYAYLTYYEQPAVIAAIRALGLRYNDKPLPEGYPDEPFDRRSDAPRHARGRWVRTQDVRRVDLGGLDLEETR